MWLLLLGSCYSPQINYKKKLSCTIQQKINDKKNCLNQCQQADYHPREFELLNQCQAIAIPVALMALSYCGCWVQCNFTFINQKKTIILMTPIFQSISQNFSLKFKPQPSITIVDEFHFLFADEFCFLFVTMCWVSSLSSVISKFHFSLYLCSKLIDIWFLLFFCLISLSFSISSFFFA